MEAPKTFTIPFSPENTEKKPITQTVALTVGPLPVQGVASAVIQMGPQGWVIEHVLFAGLAANSKLAIQQNNASPIYLLIVTKTVHEGEEVAYPKLWESSQTNPLNGSVIQ